MSAITAKASRKMKKYAVLTREPRCFLGSFDFSWEQRKLGDVVKEITRNDPESEAPIMMITANNGFIEQSERYAFNNAGESLKKYILLKKGELAYNHGASKLRPYGSCFALTTAENARIPFVYHCFSAENQNAEFMSIELNGAEIENQLRKIVSSGARMDGLLNISFDEYTSVSVLLPGTEEQDRIADFFRHLDNLITLHQRKCVFLFGFFQAFISMIFTASTFSWEQRKLGELVDRVVRKNTNNESTLPLTISAQYGLVDQITYFNNRVASRDVSNYYLVLNGEFAYNKSTSDGYPFGAVKRLDLYEKGVLSTLYIVFAPKKEQQIDSDYLTVFFDTDRWHKGVAERAAEGARNHGLLNISAEDFFDIDLSVPKDIVEQKQIGAFIRQLDSLITLHQRECISFTARAGGLILTANKKRNTSSWEQRKLSEMCGTFEYGLNAAAKEFDGNNKYIRITDIDDASREFLLSDLSSPDICLDGMSKYLLSSGDIVFARTGASVGKTYIYRENDGIVYFAGFLIRAKVNQDNDAEFVFQSTLSPSYEKYIRITSQRSGQPGVNAQEYGEYDLFAPSKEEQQRIGHFLRGIDNLITLHQRKPFLMKWRTSDANRNQTNRLVL